MTPGRTLIEAAVPLAAGSACLWCIRPARRLSYPAGVLAAASLGVALLLLLAAFGRPDFSLRAVYEYTASSDPLPYRLAAAFSGREGSLLLLVLAVAAGTLLRRSRTPVGALLVAVLAAVVLVTADPFAPLVRGGLLWTPGEGRGMSLALRHPLVLVHPVMLLVGLGLALAWSAGVLSGEDRRLLLRFAWAGTTAGCALGAAWAYTAMGWGGYWSWDPVESASLLPWLALTAALHLPPGARRWRAVAAAATWLSVFAALAVARGWAPQSLHGFAAGGEVWPMAALALCGGGALAIRAFLEGGGSPPAGTVPLLLALAALWVGVGVGPVMPAAPQRGYYDAIAAPLGLFLALYLATSPLLARPWRVAPFLFAGAAALCLPALSPAGPVAAVALLGASVCVLLLRLPRAGRRGLAHLGFVLLSLGVASSTHLGRSAELSLGLGERGELFDRRLGLVGLFTCPGYARAEVDFGHARLAPERVFDERSGEWVARVAVSSRPHEDLWCALLGAGDGLARLRVEVLPGLQLIWWGAGLTALAGLLPSRRGEGRD